MLPRTLMMDITDGMVLIQCISMVVIEDIIHNGTPNVSTMEIGKL